MDAEEKLSAADAGGAAAAAPPTLVVVVVVVGAARHGTTTTTTTTTNVAAARHAAATAARCSTAARHAAAARAAAARHRRALRQLDHLHDRRAGQGFPGGDVGGDDVVLAAGPGEPVLDVLATLGLGHHRHGLEPNAEELQRQAERRKKGTRARNQK